MGFFRENQIVAFNSTGTVAVVQAVDKDSSYIRVVTIATHCSKQGSLYYGQRAGQVFVTTPENIHPISKLEYKELTGESAGSAPSADDLEEYGLEFFWFYPQSENDEKGFVMIGDILTNFSKFSYLSDTRD